MEQAQALTPVVRAYGIDDGVSHEQQVLGL
jgi:hypothetical protein